MEVGGYMDHRDDWPDGLLERDLDPAEGLEQEARQSAERIARDARNMNALLSAMANRMNEDLPADDKRHPRLTPRGSIWRSRTIVPLAAAAAIAALILLNGDGIEPNGGPDAAAGAPRTPSMMAEMDVEADRPFVVFPTSDPDIAVVWLLNPTESEE